MLVRAIAIVASLLLHGLVGYAIWPRLLQDELQVLDFGKGQDIVLAPEGMVMSEVTSLGDDVESIETQEVVPISQQRPTPQPPAVTPEQLPGVVDAAENTTTQDVVDLQPQKPAPQPSTIAAPDPLHDVIASGKTVVEQEIVKATQPPPEQPNEQKVVEADQPVLPDQLKEQKIFKADELVPPDQNKEQSAAIADQPPPPDQVKEAEIVKQDEPPTPDQLKEQAVAKAGEPSPPIPLKEPEIIKHAEPALPDQLKEQSVATADQAPPEPLKEPETDQHDGRPPLKAIEEQKPRAMEAEVQPQQIAIVTDLSSGEAKIGGDARVISFYLRKINERVQRAKVNPRTRVTGSVVLKFRVGIDGSLQSLLVLETSGSAVLDGAAVAALHRATPFPPIPPEVSVKPMTFKQRFKFIVR